jgi:hypothetical protein
MPLKLSSHFSLHISYIKLKIINTAFLGVSLTVKFMGYISLIFKGELKKQYCLLPILSTNYNIAYNNFGNCWLELHGHFQCRKSNNLLMFI